ncbi:MAG: SDR family NAD(P)-dependent oxidoreductase [Aliishimia sp.]
MDQVLVIGASGGIGSALCDALAAEGYDVLQLSRSADGFDITDEACVDRHLSDLSGLSGVIVATGALEVDGIAPEKSVKTIQARAMADQFNINAIGPALVLKHMGRMLRRDKRAFFAVLSARVGSIGDNRLGGWVSYRAAKAALNQIVHTGAIEIARSHPQSICVSLHPGTVQTSFTEKYAARHATVPAPEAAGNLLRVIDTLTPAETGKFFDWSGAQVPW